MTTFIMMIIAIGMLGIPIACFFIFLTLLYKKWKHLQKYSLISLVLALICTTTGLISYSILGTDTASSNPTIPMVQPTNNPTDLSNDSFLENVKSVIQGTVGPGEVIQSVTLDNRDLRISVDLGQKDTSLISAEELALSRTGSITDRILDLYEYDSLWDTITIDFGDLGYIKNAQKDIQKNEYGLRYFPGENFKLINSLIEQPAEATTIPESSNEIVENNGWMENPNTITTEYMIAMIESVLKQNFEEDNYTITCDHDNKIIYLYLWYDGIMAELTAIKILGGGADDEDWMSFKRSNISNAKSICDLMETCGHGDYKLSYNILNDMNQEKILLSLVNTTIIYDIMEAK